MYYYTFSRNVYKGFLSYALYMCFFFGYFKSANGTTGSVYVRSNNFTPFSLLLISFALRARSQFRADIAFLFSLGVFSGAFPSLRTNTLASLRKNRCTPRVLNFHEGNFNIFIAFFPSWTRVYTFFLFGRF